MLSRLFRGEWILAALLACAGTGSARGQFTLESLLPGCVAGEAATAQQLASVDLAGRWTGWGTVQLTANGGTYTDTWGYAPGNLSFTQDADGIFSGHYGEQSGDHHGTLQFIVCADDLDRIVGRRQVDQTAVRRGGHIADLVWTRPSQFAAVTFRARLNAGGAALDNALLDWVVYAAGTSTGRALDVALSDDQMQLRAGDYVAVVSEAHDLAGDLLVRQEFSVRHEGYNTVDVVLGVGLKRFQAYFGDQSLVPDTYPLSWRVTIEEREIEMQGTSSPTFLLPPGQYQYVVSAPETESPDEMNAERPLAFGGFVMIAGPNGDVTPVYISNLVPECSPDAESDPLDRDLGDDAIFGGYCDDFPDRSDATPLPGDDTDEEEVGDGLIQDVCDPLFLSSMLVRGALIRRMESLRGSLMEIDFNPERRSFDERERLAIRRSYDEPIGAHYDRIQVLGDERAELSRQGSLDHASRMQIDRLANELAVLESRIQLLVSERRVELDEHERRLNADPEMGYQGEAWNYYTVEMERVQSELTAINNALDCE